MVTGKSVYVEPVAGYNAVRMVWEQQVDAADIAPAFQSIQAALDSADRPLSVIVDMAARPNIPLQSTLWGALRGPFRDPRLKEWLCIGGGSMATAVARILSGATGRKNILWFDDEAAALQHLAQQEDIVAPKAT